MEASLAEAFETLDNRAVRVGRLGRLFTDCAFENRESLSWNVIDSNDI
jgi:hypothetical protein